MSTQNTKENKPVRRDKKGYLADGSTKDPNKFCKHCTLRLRGTAKKLEAHCGTFHPGLEAEWLGYEEVPESSVYENFSQWREDPGNITLVMKKDISK